MPHASQPNTTPAHELPLEKRAALTSGADAWHLNGLSKSTSYMITDGPHGLRKAVENTSMDIEHSIPATCFPPAAGMASSWNPGLVREVGVAIGEECVQEKVAVLLGPGVNIKRNPLGGRSFEFWSEDPYLAGHEAIGIVEGVQSTGVGTSLKHFAANNQETDRMRIDARVSERALREIYLPAFEHIVTKAHPWTVMCAYNQLNGTPCSQNSWLLTKVLRDEWGFDGVVISDWGAVHDRVEALKAGLNLEMPPTNTDEQVAVAVRDGLLDEDQLDRMAQGVLDLIEKATPAMQQDDHHYDLVNHGTIARRAAQESIVLLKNDDGILPLPADGSVSIAVIGEFARTPRYQGGGSSKLTPTYVSSFLGSLHIRDIPVDFSPGFALDDAEQDAALTAHAIDMAWRNDVVLFFAGLPEEAESEGFDRENIDLPQKQLRLLADIVKVNPNVVVILSNGSAVSVTPWHDSVKGLVESWLLGQEGGNALADVIFGDVSPSGKLAQTIPMSVRDDPSMPNWPGEAGHVDYGEGVFVGYRYYDTFDRQVAYPFGYGMTYSTFEIRNLSAIPHDNTVQVSAIITNTGQVRATEVVQLYVAPCACDAARPVHELKGFEKITLDPGEASIVTFELDSRSFAYWSEPRNDWHVERGIYTIEIGSSSRDIADRVQVELPGDGMRLPLTLSSTFGEWSSDPIGGPILQAAINRLSQQEGHPIIPESDMIRMLLDSMPMNATNVLLGSAASRLCERIMGLYNASNQ